MPTGRTVPVAFAPCSRLPREVLRRDLHLDQVDLETVMIGLLTIFLILTLEKTSLKSLGMVAALIAASLVDGGMSAGLGLPLFGAIAGE